MLHSPIYLITRQFQNEIRISDVTELSIQRFKTKKLRTFLTVAGIGIGIGTVFFLVSLIFGLQQIVVGNLATSESLLTLDVLPNAEVKNIVNLNTKTLNEMKKIEGVERVTAVKALAGEVDLNKVKTQTTVYGVENALFRLAVINPRRGEVFTDEEPKRAVVTTAVLALYNIPDKDAIGKKFRLSFIISPDTVIQKNSAEATDSAALKAKSVTIPHQLEIAGVVEDETSAIYIQQDNFSIADIDEYRYAKVKVRDSTVFEQVREDIVGRGFVVTAMTDTLDQINKIFQATQVLFTIIGIVALFVAAIGMFNTMTIALLERTREIGIMKAIGATEKAVYQLFLAESIVMGIGGSITGLVFGYLGTIAINALVNALAVTLGGQWLNLFYTPPWFVGLILLFGITIGFLTGFFPARRASKINPLTALRYE